MRLLYRPLCALLFFGYAITAHCQTYNLEWVKQVASPSEEFFGGLNYTANGLRWVGTSTDSIEIGDTTFRGQPPYIQQETFVTKFDTAGNFIWASTTASYSAFSFVWVRGAVTDRQGNIYMVGVVIDCDTVHFGSITIVPRNFSSDYYFIAKTDSNGRFIWAQLAGYGDADGRAITIDKEGSLYVSGIFSNDSIRLGTFLLQGGSQGALFLAKYDSAGNVLWAQSASQLMANGNNYPPSSAIACDSLGNVYVAGGFLGDSLLFGSHVLVNTTDVPPNATLYTAAYNNSGQLMWAEKSVSNVPDYDLSLAATNSGTYMAGIFQGRQITLGSYTLTNADTTGLSTDIFIARIDSAGNFIWAKRAGGTLGEVVTQVVLNKQANLLITGGFSSTPFTLGTITLTNTYNGAQAYFVAEYDSNGNAFWADDAPTTGQDVGNSLALDNDGNIYVLGSLLYGITNFDSLSTFLDSSSSSNGTVFLAKYAHCLALSAGNIMGPDSLCAGSQITLNDSALGGTWSSSDTSIATINNTGSLTGNQEGTASVTYTVSNGCGTQSTNLLVTVDTAPNPIITFAGSQLSTTSPGTYQWYYNGHLITGATQATYTPTQNGEYYVVVSNGGCSGQSQAYNVMGLAINETVTDKIKIVPNPASDMVITEGIIADKISLLDINGQPVKTLRNTNYISLDGLADGVYLVQLFDANGNIVANARVIKQ